jgi:DNA-binding NarL/FixJ family response regulator
MKRILLVDDHAILRAGLRRLLAPTVSTDILEAATAEEALEATRTKRPDLIVLDLNLPGLGGLELLRRLLREPASRRILVLSMHAEPLFAVRALEAGAQGYMSKNAPPEELLEAVRLVLAGGRYVEARIAQQIAVQGTEVAHPLRQLTERDLEVMRLLARGSSLQQIADTLGLAYKTVANTCSQIKSKLGVARTADLVRMAGEFGMS